jgi:hypothetical protein
VSLLFDELAATSETVAATSKRNAKVAASAEVLRRLDSNEVIDAVAFVTVQTAIGRIGVGWAALRDVRPTPATDPTLSVSDAADGIALLSALTGGSAALDAVQLDPVQASAATSATEVTEAMGLRSFFFDAMHLDGESIHDEPLAARCNLLHEFVPAEERLPSIITADAAEAQRFMSEAVCLGHEGGVVKGVEEPYQAGRRGKSWRKVKPVHTLDLVVIAIEWAMADEPENLELAPCGLR